ncbi:MarR family winged helix-turn-helix transcriptional regulator [Varunaivibrio sulfuroxidans]|uniref:DNA-binding MarR family transcriptional regulator n=1 Tax=Varunaivibrio sulfuroxidans TaxID=1773489 RepID=A0A4R3J8E7_9PROT|nr:MarR family transcriptional regulator [Varunaivibrio sulfuroxidans]TCS62229.1 DNA-binding MarR family transcriptional regulator [Varunaivibrio sulfuroxidans]WES30654.1 MarR family transcriptional regulator [Varunaivibrio sulfuroxidans]
MSDYKEGVRACAAHGGEVEALEPGSARLELDRFFPYRLSVLQGLVTRTIAQIYAQQFSLTIYEWRILAVLGHEQPLIASEIGLRANLDKVQVSRAIGRMLEHGLLIRRQDISDKRRSRLRMSAKGRKIYQDIIPRARARERQLLDSLAPEEISQLDNLMKKLLLRAQEMIAEDA